MISPRELSDIFGIPVRTLTRLAQVGQIPAIKVGRHWRFFRQDIMRWIDDNPTRRIRVLHIDDDVDLLRVTRANLEVLDLEVHTAASGWEGLDMLKRDRRFALLILDLNLPDLDGPRIMSWMQAHRLKTEILVFTGYPNSDLMARALRYGPYTVVRKPTSPENLRRVVSGVLRGIINRETLAAPVNA